MTDLRKVWHLGAGMPPAPTVRVVLDSDEWYPVYELFNIPPERVDDSGIVEVPVALRERHDAALKEFRAVQVILREVSQARREGQS